MQMNTIVWRKLGICCVKSGGMYCIAAIVLVRNMRRWLCNKFL